MTKPQKGENFDSEIYGDGLEYNEGAMMLQDNDFEDPREAQLREKLEAGQRKNARLAGMTGISLQDNQIADLEGAEMHTDPLM